MVNTTPTDLHQQICESCDDSASPMLPADISQYLPMLDGWVVEEPHDVPALQKAYQFSNFVSALAFTNQLGALAEKNDHHPAILLEWGQVTVSWWTHSIGGLHKNDFVMAAKTDQVLSEV